MDKKKKMQKHTNKIAFWWRRNDKNAFLKYANRGI